MSAPGGLTPREHSTYIWLCSRTFTSYARFGLLLLDPDLSIGRVALWYPEEDVLKTRTPNFLSLTEAVWQ